MDNELYPTDSNLLNLEAPEEVREENAEAKNQILASAPIIPSLLEWFDTEIALADSIDGLDLESSIDIKAQILARQLLKAKLEASRSRLVAQKDSFIPTYRQ